MELAYVGSYTTAKRGGLETGGISVFKRESKADSWENIQVYEMMNPSYLAFGNNKRNLYAVRADGCIITAFSVEQSGKLTYLNEKHIGFDNGVFLTTDKLSKYLFVASPGGVVSIQLEKDGSLGELCDVFTPLGELGPLRQAQRRACSHQICFDRDYEYLIEPNKGLDQLNTYTFDEKNGCMNQVYSAKMPQGCCPRHIAFHPTKRIAYLLTEWIGNVITCAYENGQFKPIEIISTTPSSFVGPKNLGAEIAVHPSGKFVFASNRGHNSIVTFRVKEDGGLESVDWCTNGVQKPRFFALSEDGENLYCANEEGHSITCFRIDLSCGKLTLLDTVMRASAPACILFKTSNKN